MAEAHETGYLSIGEVLGLLLEDFPDVTISKIRFLESQGLISPERTASGYRKFYDADVDLLRVILTEQRSNYLPLRVIKDRLANGEIDPTGDHLRPEDADGAPARSESGEPPEPAAEVPSDSVSKHPASRSARNGTTPADSPRPDDPDPHVATDSTAAGADAVAHSSAAGSPAGEEREPATRPGPAAARGTKLMAGVLLDRAELCSMVGMTDRELDQLESFGIVATRDGTTPGLYGDDAVEVAKPACEFLRAGVDARHLRSWRTSAEREVSLYEQLVTPRMRQRNPESRAQALDELRRLDELGANLRSAMMRQALRRHFES